MSIFSGFSNISSALSNATSGLSNITNSISSFTRNLNNGLRQVSSVANTVTSFVSNPLGALTSATRNAASNIDSLLTGFGANLNGLGAGIRMVGNAAQGVSVGANPASRSVVNATVAQSVSTRNDTAAANDWRVSLAVPSLIQGGEVLRPLGNTGNRMVFPFNPVILFGQTASYSSISPTHSNYNFHAYQNSQIDNITITGEFVNENESDAKYWIAVIHYLRVMTKMFYGNGDNLGNPPLMTRLNGYGKHVLNDIPVVISNFTVDLPADVDYIPCVISGQTNYVPVQSQVTVTCMPNYARRSVAKFDLKTFADGGFVGGKEGFI
jgi:hypothetical protein